MKLTVYNPTPTPQPTGPEVALALECDGEGYVRVVMRRPAGWNHSNPNIGRFQVKDGRIEFFRYANPNKELVRLDDTGLIRVV